MPGGLRSLSVHRKKAVPCGTAWGDLISNALFILLVIDGNRLRGQSLLDAPDALSDAAAQLGQALAPEEHESYRQYQ